MRWPLAWLQPQTEDGVLRFGIRLLGAASLLFAIFVIMALIVIAGAIADPPTGWEGVIIGVAVLVGGGSLLLASGFSWLAHRSARDVHDPAVRVGAWVLTILGATFWAPIAWQQHVAPLDRYVAALRFGMLALGAVMLWRLSRSQSRPA